MPAFAHSDAAPPPASPCETTNSTAGPGVRHSTASVTANNNHRENDTGFLQVPDTRSSGRFGPRGTRSLLLALPAVAFLLECGACGRELAALGRIDVREFELEVLQPADNRRRNHQARKPFVVGRNDVPRRVRRRGALNHVVVRVLILGPVVPLVCIGEREFPVLLRHLEAREEAL